VAHEKRADSADLKDGRLELDFFTDQGSGNAVVFTLFAKSYAAVYIAFPPASVVHKARTPGGEKALIRWLVDHMHRSSRCRTFELKDGKAISSA
jgi:hypothetical protein